MNLSQLAALLERMYQIDLDLDLDGISDRFDKDKKRIRAFLDAVHQRTGEFVRTTVQLAASGNLEAAEAEIVQMRIFGNNARELVMQFVAALMGLHKLQFPKDFVPRWLGGTGKAYDKEYRDVTKGARESTRAFARVWQLDPKFVEMMG